MDLIIHNERETETRIVEELTREAFWNVHVPGCNEHYCLHNMRQSADFIKELDLVAEYEGRVIGNIVYTKGSIVDDRGKKHEVVSFGPISVLPKFQRQGVGGKLIKHSLALAKKMGFRAVLIYGDPRYYYRFGFRCAEKYDVQTAQGQYAIALMALELQQGALASAAGRFVESDSLEVDQAEFEIFERTFPPKEKKYDTRSQLEFSVLASVRF